jgi:hypothetical protein
LSTIPVIDERPGGGYDNVLARRFSNGPEEKDGDVEPGRCEHLKRMTDKQIEKGMTPSVRNSPAATVR